MARASRADSGSCQPAASAAAEPAGAELLLPPPSPLPASAAALEFGNSSLLVASELSLEPVAMASTGGNAWMQGPLPLLGLVAAAAAAGRRPSTEVGRMRDRRWERSCVRYCSAMGTSWRLVRPPQRVKGLVIISANTGS